MDILSIVVLIIAIVKKDKRCLPVCILACLYSIMHSIFRTPQLADTLLYDVFSVVNIPFLITMLIVTVLVFRKPFENEKRYILPIICCTGVLLNKVTRRIFFCIQAERVNGVGADGYEIFKQISRGSNYLDIIYSVFFCGMIVALICVLNRAKTERDS